MGFMDRMVGSMASKLAGQHGASVQAAIDLFHEHGGLPGVLDRFRSHAMSAEVDSWVAVGENLPLSAKQVKRVFAQETLSHIAKHLGMTMDEVAEKLAEYLPKAVDRLTPAGKVPESNTAVLLQALSWLKNQ